MPLPTASDVHVNRPLSNVLVAFMNQQQNFIATRAAPIIPSPTQGNRYFVYDRADWLRDEAKVRAPATESAGGGWRLDNTQSYFCDVFAFHKDVDDQIRANQDAPINLDRDATEYVAQKILLKREKEWASAFFTTSVWSSDVTPSPLWDAVNSTPISDIRTQMFTIHQNTGVKPNILVLGAKTWEALQDNEDFIARIQFGTPSAPSIVSPNLLAQVLGLDEVLVCGAVEATSVEADATPAFDFVQGKHALLAYRPPRPGILVPSAMYTFAWTGYLGASAMGTRVKRFRMEPLAADRVEGEGAWDFKVVASSLGVFFNSAVS